MDKEVLEDIMDDLREIHATHCKNWNASFVCDCLILQVMNKIYVAQQSVQRTAIKHCDFCGIDTFDDEFGRCSICQNRRR